MPTQSITLNIKNIEKDKKNQPNPYYTFPNQKATLWKQKKTKANINHFKRSNLMEQTLIESESINLETFFIEITEEFVFVAYQSSLWNNQSMQMGRNRISSEAFVSFISRILFFDVTEFLSQFFLLWNRKWNEER